MILPDGTTTSSSISCLDNVSLVIERASSLQITRLNYYILLDKIFHSTADMRMVLYKFVTDWFIDRETAQAGI